MTGQPGSAAAGSPELTRAARHPHVMSGYRRGRVPRSQLLPATSEGPDVLGLRPLAAADRSVLNALVVLQAAVAVGLD